MPPNVPGDVCGMPRESCIAKLAAPRRVRTWKNRKAAHDMTNSQYDLLMPNKTEVTPAPSMHAARANRPPALSAAYPDRNFPWSGKHRQRLAKQAHTTKQPPRTMGYTA